MEISNKVRANRAMAAVEAYARSKSEPIANIDEAINDLTTDLLHLVAQRTNREEDVLPAIAALVSRAQLHFVSEYEIAEINLKKEATN